MHRESDCEVTECRKKRVKSSEDFTMFLEGDKYAEMTEDEILRAADEQDQRELRVLSVLNGKVSEEQGENVFRP